MPKSKQPRKSKTGTAFGNSDNQVQDPVKGVAQQDNANFYYMAAALAIYERDEQIKQRHLNVLLESEVPQITRNTLQVLNRQVLDRLNQENEVTPDMVKDVVFLNINMLGRMSPEDFHGSPVDESTEKPS